MDKGDWTERSLAVEEQFVAPPQAYANPCSGTPLAPRPLKTPSSRPIRAENNPLAAPTGYHPQLRHHEICEGVTVDSFATLEGGRHRPRSGPAQRAERRRAALSAVRRSRCPPHGCSSTEDTRYAMRMLAYYERYIYVPQEDMRSYGPADWLPWMSEEKDVKRSKKGGVITL